MSDHVEGVVQKITSKAAGRSGDLVYNICVDTGGRDDEWFGYGFDEPNFQEGDEIAFDVTYNGDYANVDVNSVEVLNEGDGGSRSNSRGNSRGGSSRSSGSSRGGSSRGGASRKPAAKRGGGGRDKPAAKKADDGMSKEDWANKDKMIRRQACMNTAIALVRMLNEAGALPTEALPTKKAEKCDALIAFTDEEANRLYDQYEEQVYPKPKAASRRGGRNTQEEYDDDDIPD